MLAGAPDVFLSIDDAGLIREWNHAATALTGWSAEEVIGQPLGTTLLPVEGRAGHLVRLQRYLSAGSDLACDDTGTVLGAVVSLRDITDAVAAQKALARSTAQSKATFDASPVPSAILNAAGRFVAANAAMSAMLGRDTSALTGASFDAITGPDLPPARAADMDPDTGDDWTRTRHNTGDTMAGDWSIGGVERRFRRPDGASVCAIVTFTGLHDDAGPRRLVQAQDITARRQAEEHADRHMRALAAIIETQRAVTAAVHDRDEVLRVVADRALTAVPAADGLLAYATARDAPLRPAWTDLAAMVAHIVTVRTSHLPSEDEPDISTGPLPAVWADLGMLRQVLDNLIGNAIKYTKPGTRAQVAVTTEPRDATVRICIADRGIGIPADQRQQVLSSFHRAHTGQGYAGTDLGLAICQRVIDRHGGTITIEDNPGGGTCVTLLLPQPAPTRADPAR